MAEEMLALSVSCQYVERSAVGDCPSLGCPVKPWAYSVRTVLLDPQTHSWDSILCVCVLGKGEGALLSKWLPSGRWHTAKHLNMLALPCVWILIKMDESPYCARREFPTQFYINSQWSHSVIDSDSVLVIIVNKFMD